MGCQAKIKTKKFSTYPDYKITLEQTKGKSQREIQQLQKGRLEDLKSALKQTKPDVRVVVELQAAASLLKLPIYVFTQKGGSGDYYWEIFKPMKDPLKLPDSTIEKPRGVDHYEICHTLGCRYDLITLTDGLWQ